MVKDKIIDGIKYSVKGINHKDWSEIMELISSSYKYQIMKEMSEKDQKDVQVLTHEIALKIENIVKKYVIDPKDLLIDNLEESAFKQLYAFITEDCTPKKNLE